MSCGTPYCGRLVPDAEFHDDEFMDADFTLIGYIGSNVQQQDSEVKLADPVFCYVDDTDQSDELVGVCGEKCAWTIRGVERSDVVEYFSVFGNSHLGIDWNEQALLVGRDVVWHISQVPEFATMYSYVQTLPSHIYGARARIGRRDELLNWCNIVAGQARRQYAATRGVHEHAVLGAFSTL